MPRPLKVLFLLSVMHWNGLLPSISQAQLEHTKILFESSRDGNSEIYVMNANGSNQTRLTFNYGGQADPAWSPFPSGVSPVTFTEVSGIAGLLATGPGYGIGWGDYDNDGDEDLYVPRNNPSLVEQFYRNNGNGTFTEVGTSSGVALGSGMGVTWGDYDNDGDLDAYVVVGQGPGGINNRLYRNEGNGTFTEVALDAGVNVQSSGGAAWGDYDNDGWLDLYLARRSQPNTLYRNNGNGTFQTVAANAGVNLTNDAITPAWGDYDDDGDLDLYLVNDSDSVSRLFRNNGNGTFSQVAASAGVANTGSGRGVAWGDYDNDGDLDIVVANAESGAMRLYQNQGNGSFVNRSALAGTNNTPAANGVAWADYDRDGYLDLYVSNVGFPNQLFRNRGDGTFEEVAATVNVQGNATDASTGVTWVDYDNDGDMDIYVLNDGADQTNYLFQNEGNANKWLELTLRGTLSNRAAIGARVHSFTGSMRQRRDVDGGSGLLSQPSLPVEFGFGGISTVDSVVILWPSGTRQVLTSITTNQRLTVIEGINDLTPPINEIIRTIAGNGTAAYSGDNSPATQASLNRPFGILAHSGNLYIADYTNHVIRKVDSQGTMTTIAGDGFGAGITNGGRYGGDNGPATQASLNTPEEMAFDSHGNLYIADVFNHRIRRVTPAGIISTVAGDGFSAGNGNGRFTGDNGPATESSLSAPTGVAVDADDILYISDTYNHRVRRVDTNGIITTIAGDGDQGFSGDGGAATAARLRYPNGLAIDSEGNLFVADEINGRIRRVDTQGIITTVAGDGVVVDNFGRFFGEGIPAIQASLSRPSAIAFDADDNLYVADQFNHRIRKIDTSGIITTVAGDGFMDSQHGGRYTGDGGPALLASLDAPVGVTVDAVGNVFIADSDNNRIRKVIRAQAPSIVTHAVMIGLPPAFGAPGDTLRIPLILTSVENSVGGLQLDIPITGGIPAEFVTLEDSTGGFGFTGLHSTFGDTTRLIFHSPATDLLPVGTITLGHLVIRLDADAPLGSTHPLQLVNVEVSDSSGFLLPDSVVFGEIQVGIRGDLNLDGHVSILDIIRIARIIVGKSVTPDSGSTAFHIADMDVSGIIDVADVV